MEKDQFVNIQLKYDVIDIYGVRKAIGKSIKEQLSKFTGILLDVGCGQMPYKKLLVSSPSKVVKYIGLDLEKSVIYDTSKAADLFWDGKRIPLQDNAVDCAIATEVFEHCFDIQTVLKEINRVLKPGGILFFTVPFLWPLHDVPYDACRYTPFYMQQYLYNSGYSVVELKALGGWDASLAQMIGLWARRRSFTEIKRKIISIAVLPIIKFLLSKDVPPAQFHESSMITGLSGIAKK